LSSTKSTAGSFVRTGLPSRNFELQLAAAADHLFGRDAVNFFRESAQEFGARRPKR
jgi:hypothetical protein